MSLRATIKLIFLWRKVRVSMKIIWIPFTLFMIIINHFRFPSEATYRCNLELSDSGHIVFIIDTIS